MSWVREVRRVRRMSWVVQHRVVVRCSHVDIIIIHVHTDGGAVLAAAFVSLLGGELVLLSVRCRIRHG